MEFGSATLADLWGDETALGEGPYFAGKDFSLVDAVFAPVYGYFEVFDAISDSHIFDALPEVNAWRKALAARPSVRDAVVPEYPRHLMEFLERHQAHLPTLAA